MSERTWIPKSKLTALKSQLTRAKNQNDADKIIKACKNFRTTMDDNNYVWPDNWHTWNIALSDVAMAIPGREYTIAQIQRARAEQNNWR